MDELTQRFLREAGSIRLNADEQKTIRKNLQGLIKAEAKKEPELDELTAAFFLEAKVLALTPEERVEFRKDMRVYLRHHSVSEKSVERQQKRMAAGLFNFGKGKPALRKQEKKHARESLRMFIHNNPVRDEALAEGSYLDHVEHWLQAFFRGILPRTAFLVVVFFLIGSGVSYAAEGSLPGEFLYSFKVYISEPVRSKIQFSDSAQAQWEGSRALRRLHEAEELAARSALTESALTQIEEHFVNHIDHAERYIKDVAQSGDPLSAAQLSTTLESSLGAHSSILSRIAEHAPDMRSAMETVIRGIDTAKESVGDIRTGSEDRLQVGVGTEGGKERAQKRIADALSTIENVRASMKVSGSPRSAQDLLQAAQVMLDEANVNLTGGKFEDALSQSREVLRLTEEAKLMLKLDAILPESSASSANSAAASSAVSAASESSSSAATSGSSSDNALPWFPDIPIPDVPGANLIPDLTELPVDVPSL